MTTEEENISKLPQFSHEDVINHPKLFWDTLGSLHSSLGTTINVPVIEGKEVDLHILYSEVTKRGGFYKVVEDKKWREINTVFQIPPITTSASYVLRKNYFSYLLHYEEIYFSKLRSHVIPQTISPVAFHVKNPSCTPAIAGLGEFFSDPFHKGPQDGASGSKGFMVGGSINGKFEHGYLVSVKIGNELLHGVLYHPDSAEYSSPTPSNATTIVPYNSEPSSSRRRRKNRRRVEDPDRPKRNKSGYKFFLSAKHAELKSLYPDREREFFKMIAQTWSVMTDTEKKVYEDLGAKDKERYQKELKAYKEGVLYYPDSAEYASPTPSNATTIVPYNSEPSSSRRRRKKPRRVEDPDRPKRNKSGYKFFLSAKHAELKSLYPDREREFFKMIAQAWSVMTDTEKKVYEDLGAKDKERYQKELKAYKEGVLYHPDLAEYASPTPSNATTIVPYNSEPSSSRRRRKKRRRVGDPDHPKRNKSGYKFFLSAKHAELKSLYPDREREFFKMIAQAWSVMTDTEKKVYEDLGAKDKDRYQKELKTYKEGVLYHPDSTEYVSPTPSNATIIVPYNSEPSSSRRRRKKRRRVEDPDRPKRNKSGYKFFLSAKHAELKSLYPDREREFFKMISQAWSVMSDTKKKVYEDLGTKDKERYQRELKAYKEGKQLLLTFKQT